MTVILAIMLLWTLRFVVNLFLTIVFPIAFVAVGLVSFFTTIWFKTVKNYIKKNLVGFVSRTQSHCDDLRT